MFEKKGKCFMMTDKERIVKLERQLVDATADIKILEEENESLQNEVEDVEKDNQALGVAYELLGQDYDDLYREYNELANGDNRTAHEIIDKIHELIGNGITAGDFKRIADMLSTEYSIKGPIYGLDY
jgi:predicted  nucleic acid-binding Zn-ribbon protein